MAAPKLDALLSLGALLAPAAKRLPPAVSQAFSRPQAYVDAHERALGRRAIREPQGNLPWIALIDALAAAKVLVEIDWKAEADEVQAALRTLVKGFRGLPRPARTLEERVGRRPAVRADPQRAREDAPAARAHRGDGALRQG